MRVLVVDDEPDMVMTLLTVLRSEGYDAQGFGSGKEALKAVETFDPDVIVSDIAMPLVNGWDVAAGVLKRKAARRPLLIGLSGRYVKDTDHAVAQTKGFNHYLTKPCDPADLLALIAPLRAAE